MAGMASPQEARRITGEYILIVEQIWTANTYRNFNYLIACDETGEALAVDPLDHKKCLAEARERGWEIRQIVNTHEHGDHTGGNRATIAATGAKLLAHAGARDAIPGIDRGLAAGDTIRIGKTVELEVLDTPGHTMSHVCLFAHIPGPALFCGDTLFNAGAGNCHNGGHPSNLYETFANQLFKLPDETLIYPGHDYIVNNLKFTLDREPENSVAANLLEKVADQDPDSALVSNLGLEREVNVFFRLQNPKVIQHIRDVNPELGDHPDPRRVFLALRALRNIW